jgi:HTH-type transcriptional regulator / antitoxin HipB
MDEIAQALRAARHRKRMSQRALSALTGVPQGHISRIEAGSVDIRLSSLIELARALDLEPMLVPRILLPAVRTIIAPPPDEAVRPAYSLDEEEGG